MEKVFGNTLLRIRELSSEENVAVFNQKLRLCAGFAYERAFGQDDLEEMNKIAEDEEKHQEIFRDLIGNYLGGVPSMGISPTTKAKTIEEILKVSKLANK